MVAALLLVTTGCEIGTDDEMAPAPTKTITATPSQSVAPAPATIPVGQGKVSPTDSVWADGGVLHVGRKQVDLSPIEIEAFVVVPGGVFLLSQGELWFTDLTKVKGTGQTDVTGVRTNADGTVLEVVDMRSGEPLSQGYDTATGRAIRGQVATLTPEEMRDGTGDEHPQLRLPNGGPSAGGCDDSTVLGTGVLRGGDRQVVRCSASVPALPRRGLAARRHHDGGLRHREVAPPEERGLPGITAVPPLG